MAEKYNLISALAEQTAAKVTRNETEWLKYLNTSSNLYKYQFNEQILIYAQRPDAKACATIELWNEKLSRWVNKGSKGIALIDESSEWPKLKYVFDISDTHKSKQIGKDPFIWQYKEDHSEIVMERLQKSFGLEKNNKENLDDYLIKAAEIIVNDKYEDYTKDIIFDKEDSFLEELDELNVNVLFKELMTSSLAYTILKRTGFNVDDYENEFNFEGITNFNNITVLSYLGAAVNENAKLVLQEIGYAIKEYEISKNRLEKESKMSYNEFNTLKRKSDIERGSENGDSISEEWGLPNTKFSDGQQYTGTDRKVWNDEKDISEGTQGSEIPVTAFEGETYRAPSGNIEDSTVESRQDDGRNAATGYGSRQRKESNGVGSIYEQPSDEGRRNSIEGINLQLDLFKTVKDQIEDIENAKEEETFAFSAYQEEIEEEKSHKQASNGLINFRITDDNLGVGGAKTKYLNNINAIKTLQKIETENRRAEPEEQEILSRYVGWGGISQAFDDKNSNWAKEHIDLKEILNDSEYSKARESTLNAYYTSPVIIKSIYETIERMGFKKGNILEPSMGVGNFFGNIPESMKEAKLYGVELDSITGRIAKQLYQKADITISGFEKTDFPNNFFDLAIGNVPFGSYKVMDKQYDKHNFFIHDYFYAKTLDKVRAGGIIAFITSKGTLDKNNPEVRKYIAQRAELLGAVRLPDNAFLANAGTEVTADIIFLKKRERILDIEPEWVHLGKTEDNISINSYFEEHPEMVLGKMEYSERMYGSEKTTTCRALEEENLGERLKEALLNINGEIDEVYIDETLEETNKSVIPADLNVKNFSYCIVGENIYYRENSKMSLLEIPKIQESRIRGMIGIRDATRELINYQLEEYSDNDISIKQKELNELYDDFTNKYGLINSTANKRAFRDDSSYCLLCSLEILKDDGTLKRKADMFSKKTIKKQVIVESVDTASEALTLSIGEKAKVDLEYMSKLSGKSNQQIITDLKGVIFKNPITDRYETADEYLSGNVREKLHIAQEFLTNNPEYDINVEALKKVQPKDLEASEIEVRLGATWIETEIIKKFMIELFNPPEYIANRQMEVEFSKITGQWNIKGKNADRYDNVLANVTYGTGRANGYKILEDSLNLRDVRIFDKISEPDGTEKRVLNKKETMLAGQKQEAIREAFKVWIFKDAERRETLCTKYNELFNSTRPREYDGSHINFQGMTPEIRLRTHQLNAVAHVLYGGNTLLAHCVGAGKTFEMIAAAMESKRLGLAQKSLFVVPNHLTEQWAADFLRLYPGANILAATKKDFEPQNRKKFCSRIATGEYDAVIIGHSQFEKIPLSIERQETQIQRQINEITNELSRAKEENGERYSIKQMEKTKKALETRLEKLNDSSRKDDVVTFEELGVDRLFVDEAHSYKNLFLYTKMRNVAGIAQTEAQKSSDMFAKCQYMDEITGARGVTFATGTPISNSMTELYTMMRYLQYNTLQKLGLGHFDSWASSFGETVTAIELSPEGTGYRAKTRFARFFNLPELISLFKESADIQTPDMLKLPVPEAEYKDVVLKPSEYQKEIVQGLAERAESVRDRRVEPNVDNMLKITNDGRKLALDERLINDMLPDEEGSKTNACVDNTFNIWKETSINKSTQLIFCDLSTPHKDGRFNVYEAIKEKLINKGVPSEEITFIHDANTEVKKAELFAKVRSGQVRILLGSTAKMGAGTNVQDKLIALHHLDVPWKPSDIEQQEGRILRQGNENKKVNIFRYVTEGTFDSYSWQLIENKQKFIGQIMTSKSPVRSCEDIDEAALSYAEVKALATGNPYIKEKMDLDIQVSKLKLLKSNHISQQYRLEDNIAKHYPNEISKTKEIIKNYKKDIECFKNNKPVNSEGFYIKLNGKIFTDKKQAGLVIIEACKDINKVKSGESIGKYAGFSISIKSDIFSNKFLVVLKNQATYITELGNDTLGNITRINNILERIPEKLEESEAKLKNIYKQLESAKVEVQKPFLQEQELSEKQSRLAELNNILNMEEKDIKEMEEKNDDNSIIKKAENLINNMENTQTLFGKDERNLIVNYAYHTGDIKKVEELAERLAEEGHEMVKGYVNPEVRLQVEKEILAIEALSQNKSSISYYVAGCMEFKTLGEYQEGISTIKEAVEIYNNIPDERLNGGKGIGFIIHDDEDHFNDGSEFDLFSNDVIDVDLINSMSYFKESPLVQEAIEEIKKYFPDKIRETQSSKNLINTKDNFIYEKAESFAIRFDEFSYQYDTYEYNDTVDSREDQIRNIANDILCGNAEYINEWLNKVIENGSDQDIEDAKDFLKEIADINKIKENPLAKLEEIIEQNYNNIDGVINNIPEVREKKKPSLKEQLKDMKNKVCESKREINTESSKGKEVEL